jgi:hypothetical protein
MGPVRCSGWLARPACAGPAHPSAMIPTTTQLGRFERPFARNQAVKPPFRGTLGRQAAFRSCHAMRVIASPTTHGCPLASGLRGRSSPACFLACTRSWFSSLLNLFPFPVGVRAVFLQRTDYVSHSFPYSCFLFLVCDQVTLIATIGLGPSRSVASSRPSKHSNTPAPSSVSKLQLCGLAHCNSVSTAQIPNCGEKHSANLCCLRIAGLKLRVLASGT